MVTLELHQINDPTAGPKDSSSHGRPARPNWMRAASIDQNTSRDTTEFWSRFIAEPFRRGFPQCAWAAMKSCPKTVEKSLETSSVIGLDTGTVWIPPLQNETPSRQSCREEKCKNVVQFVKVDFSSTPGCRDQHGAAAQVDKRSSAIRQYLCSITVQPTSSSLAPGRMQTAVPAFPGKSSSMDCRWQRQTQQVTVSSIIQASLAL